MILVIVHGFKIGDLVRVKKDCSHECGLRFSHKGITGKIARIMEIGNIQVIYDHSPNYTTGINFIHYPSCLEMVNKGFDPKSLINKVFNTQGG